MSDTEPLNTIQFKVKHELFKFQAVFLVLGILTPILTLRQGAYFVPSTS